MNRINLLKLAIAFSLLAIIVGGMYCMSGTTANPRTFEEPNPVDTIKPVDTAKLVDMRLDTIAFLLAHRETGGTFNERAVSKCGTYVGLLQMDSWWVNKANYYIGEKKYSHNDRYDGAKSIEIWKIHQYNRNGKIGLEYGLVEALESACIIHAGGRRNDRTINYYKSLYAKVKDNTIEYFDLKEKKK